MAKERHTWHYQVMRHANTVTGESYLDLREVHLTDGVINAWTAEPVTFVGDDMGEMERSLMMALDDLKKYGVIDCPTAPEEPS